MVTHVSQCPNGAGTTGRKDSIQWAQDNGAQSQRMQLWSLGAITALAVKINYCAPVSQKHSHWHVQATWAVSKTSWLPDCHFSPLP